MAMVGGGGERGGREWGGRDGVWDTFVGDSPVMARRLGVLQRRH